jgi:hypothetical protein
MLTHRIPRQQTCILLLVYLAKLRSLGHLPGSCLPTAISVRPELEDTILNVVIVDKRAVVTTGGKGGTRSRLDLALRVSATLTFSPRCVRWEHTVEDEWIIVLAISV